MGLPSHPRVFILKNHREKHCFSSVPLAPCGKAYSGSGFLAFGRWFANASVRPSRENGSYRLPWQLPWQGVNNAFTYTVWRVSTLPSHNTSPASNAQHPMSTTQYIVLYERLAMPRSHGCTLRTLRKMQADRCRLVFSAPKFWLHGVQSICEKS